MKKLAILLSLILTPLIYSQDIYDIGKAILVSDTLSQTSGTVSDTIDYIPLNYDYEWLNITAIDTGASLTDSVVVEYPTFNYTLKSGTTRRWEISDTTWTRVQFMRDSTWTNVNIMAATGVNTYKIHVGDYKEVRLRMINVEAIAGRNFYYKAQAVNKY